MTVPPFSFQTFLGLSPFLALLCLAGLSLVLEVLLKESGRIANGVVCMLGLAGNLYWTFYLAFNHERLGLRALSPFAGALLFDALTLSAGLIVLVATAIGLLLVIGEEEIRCGEVYALVLLSALGMLLMLSAVELMSVLLGLEVMSLAIFALVGAKRTDVLSNEASLKYFLLGAFSSAIFLYGMALIYGASGSIYFHAVAAVLNRGGQSTALLTTGMALLLVGFGFKLALVPFHMWAPDAYEGAPSSVTAFMATGVKVAAFVAFVRLLITMFPELYVQWSKILSVLAILTMTLANLTALAQRSLKRMLSYSSIAHAGYILLAVIACRTGNETEAIASLLYYLLAYTFMAGGAFAVVLYTEISQPNDLGMQSDEERYAGLGWRKPWLGLALSVFLLALAGIPPTAGFLAKFYVFAAALHAGFYGLVIVAVLNSLVALFYYLRPLVWMYMVTDPAVTKEKTAFHSDNPTLAHAYVIALVVIVSAVGCLALGIFPSFYSDWSRDVAQSLTSASFMAHQ